MALRNRRLAQLALCGALAVLHTWPLATNPARLSRLDNDDTAFNTWVVAWVAHQLPRDPAHLFEAPIFLPEHDTLAYSEHMTVPALMGAPLLWADASPVLVYNVLVIAGLTLSAFAMMLLITRWTSLRSHDERARDGEVSPTSLSQGYGGPPKLQRRRKPWRRRTDSTAAGVVAGSLFAFNAHLLTRIPHLQALHVEFLPLVFYALDRLIEERRTKYAALLAVSFVLQALCSNYTMVFVALAIFIAVLVRPDAWRNPVPLWARLALAAAGAAIVLTPFLLPYYRVRNFQGLVRTLDDVRLYSASWSDYLATVARLHYQAWSYRFIDNQNALFPGVTAMVLSVVACVTGVAWRDPRARMALAFGSVGFAMSFGASLPGYAWLHEHVPLLQGIRVAARWGFLALVAVAMLAGYGVAALHARWGSRTWWPALAVGLVGLVTLEALRAPLSLVRFEGIPPVHARLRHDDVSGLVIFPLFGEPNFNRNAQYLLHQTSHWRPIVNGYSSFAPQTFYDRARRLQHFPAPAAIDELRAIGVSHVVLHKEPWERDRGQAVTALRTHPALQSVVEEDGVIIFRLK